ncbi:hypothetical protein [Massilia eburnea]|uniref:hypothetical protein n=1 Tax=Massilia eburnea TaxID=1776165 RepID=UPI003D6A0056
MGTSNSEAINRYFSQPRTLFEVISLVGTFELSSTEKRSEFLGVTEIVSDLLNKLEAQTMPLRLEFVSLSYLLIKYAEHKGSEVVIDFYKYRFCAVLVWLDALGMLNNHQLVQKFFNPAELRRTMTPEDM